MKLGENCTFAQDPAVTTQVQEQYRQGMAVVRYRALLGGVADKLPGMATEIARQTAMTQSEAFWALVAVLKRALELPWDRIRSVNLSQMLSHARQLLLDAPLGEGPATVSMWLRMIK